jgi:hypothetical protein
VSRGAIAAAGLLNSGRSRATATGHDRILVSPCKISVLNSVPMTVPGWNIGL